MERPQLKRSVLNDSAPFFMQILPSLSLAQNDGFEDVAEN
jgi:hypothetical protein